MTHIEESEPFAYKIYEIVFISLFISALVSMLEIGSQLRLNLITLILGNSSLFIPIILGVAVFHAAYIKRFELTESLKRYIYCATVLLVLLTMSIFQEIIPIMLEINENNSFYQLYSESATLQPLAMTLLSACYFWLHERAFKKPAKWIIFLPVGFIYIELNILGNRLTEIAGDKIALILGFILVIGIAVVRKFWWRD